MALEDPYSDIVGSAPTTSNGNLPHGSHDPYADLLSPQPETSSGDSSLLEKITYPLSLPKRGVDAVARASARAMGVPVPDTETTGRMLRTAVTGTPEESSVAGRLGGKALEFVGDLATDPLTYALPAGGKVGRAAGALMAPGALVGAYEEGKRAVNEIGQHGFTPAAAEDVLGAGLSGGMGVLAGAHALHGEAPAAIQPENRATAHPVDAAPITAPPDFAQDFHVGELPPDQAARQADLDSLAAQGMPSQRGISIEQMADALDKERADRAEAEGRAASEAKAAAEKARQEGIQYGAKIMGDVARKAVEPLIQEPGALPPPTGPIVAPDATPEPVDLAELKRVPVEDQFAKTQAPTDPSILAKLAGPGSVEDQYRRTSGEVGAQPVDLAALPKLPDENPPAAAPATPPENRIITPAVDEAVTASMRQAQDRLRSRDVTEGARIPMRGPDGSLQGWIGAPSVKDELGLAGIKESPKQILDALKRDKGNPLELRVKDAVQQADPFGYVQQAKDAEFNPDDERRSDSIVDRRERDTPIAFDDQRRASRRAALATEYELPEDHPAIGGIEEARYSDPLTGLGNKREWNELQSSIRPGQDHVLVLDMKKFKPINDQFGHEAGDAVLRRMAGIMSDVVGERGAVTRFGGDEFGAVLRDMPHEDAQAVVDEINRRTADSPMTLRNPTTGKTVDIPGWEVHLGLGENYEAADAAANAAAESSRKGGRGDVALSSEGGAEPAVAGPSGAGVPPGTPELGQPKYAVTEKTKAGDQYLIPGTLDAAVSARPRPTEGREAEGPLFTQEKDQAVKEEKAKQATLFRVGPKGEPQETLGIDHIKRAFVGREVVPLEDGAHQVKLANGRSIRVQMDGNIDLEPKAFKAGYGREATTGDQAVGSFQRIGPDAIIRLAKEGASEGTLAHESFHAAMDMVLSPKEKALVLDRYKTEEAAAEAYSKWSPEQPSNSLFQRIRAFFQRIYRAWKPDTESVFGKVRSGEAFGREEATPATEGVPKYATAPSQPPDVSHLTRPGEEAQPSDAPSRPLVEDNVRKLREAEGETPGAKPADLSRETPRTNQELTDEAKRIDKTYTDADFYRQMKKGPLDDAETVAWRNRVDAKATIRNTAQDALDAARAAGKDTTALQNDYANKSLDYLKALTAHVETGTAQGRALQARNVLEKFDPTSPEAVGAKLVKLGIPQESIQKVVEALHRGDPQEINRALVQAFKPSLSDKVYEAWINGMLSAPSTSVIKGVSDLLSLVGTGFERGAGSAADAARAKWTNSPRERIAGEVWAHFGGMKAVLQDALGNARKAWNEEPTGIEGNDPLNQSRAPYAIGGTAGKIIRAGYGGGGTRGLRAIDAFSKTLARSAEKHVQALRIASAEGGSRAEVAARAEQIANTPDHELVNIVGAKNARTMTDSMDSFMNRATYTAPYGPRMQAVVSAINKVPGGDVIFPFMRVPWNLAVEGAKATPMNMIKVLADIKSGKIKGAEASDAIVRPVMGTAAMMGVAMAAANGQVTGNGPEDPNARKAWMAAGNQPYSVKVPGAGWVSYKRIEPFATIIGLAADSVEATHEKKKKDMAMKAISALEAAFTQKTFLTGVEDIGGILKDPIQYGKQFAQDLESSVVPNIAAKAAQAIDPTVRDASFESGALAPIEARIPGLTGNVPAKPGLSGETIERGGTAVERALSPFPRAAEPSKYADLDSEMARLGFAPGAPKREMSLQNGKKVELTDDEMAKWSAMRERAAEMASRVLNSPTYKGAVDTPAEAPLNAAGGHRPTKEDLIKQYFNRADQEFRARYLPGIIRRARAEGAA